MNIDQQMLNLIEILKSKSIIRFDVEFCKVAGLPHQSLTRIKNGESRFRVNHIENVVKEYNINPNWIFGLEPTVFALSRKQASAV